MICFDNIKRQRIIKDQQIGRMLIRGGPPPERFFYHVAILSVLVFSMYRRLPVFHSCQGGEPEGSIDVGVTTSKLFSDFLLKMSHQEFMRRAFDMRDRDMDCCGRD